MLVSVVGIFLFGTFSFLLLYVSATSWSDDFTSGNYSDWTVVTGQYTSSDEYLREVDHTANVSYHPSDCSYGNWWFDLWENVTSMIEQHVFSLHMGQTLRQSTDIL
jgi:hypothetical protein